MSQKPSMIAVLLTGLVSGLTLVYTRGDLRFAAIAGLGILDLVEIALILGFFMLATWLIVKAWDRLVRRRWERRGVAVNRNARVRWP